MQGIDGTAAGIARVDNASARSAQKLRMVAWLLLVTSFSACAYYYLSVKKGVFDDVYIYLAVARNAIDFGSWQYYPGLVDRPALLASSPARIVVLTLAAGISDLIGHGQRTLLDARVTLFLSGIVTWLMFLPFWLRNLHRYALLGAVFALLAICYDTIFEFEGGLLLLWVASLVALCRQAPCNVRLLGWLLPIGPLIRPDLSLPILAMVFVHLAHSRADLMAQVKACIVPTLSLAVGWIVLALLLDVYPVPVTYWGKAAIPLMFENTTLLRELPERLGLTLVPSLGFQPWQNSIVGWALIGSALASLLAYRPAIRVAAIAAFVAMSCLIFYRMPANFWWYYQNIISLMIGAYAGVALASVRQADPMRMAAMALATALVAISLLGRAPNDGPHLWRTSEQTRAQGYLSMSLAATGHGTFKLPEIGEVILKNPEIGMMSYYAKTPIFQWDSAGLAQPLDDPKVAGSHMRLLYPRSLHRPAQDDAQDIVNKLGRPATVVEVWAMEDRNYANARKVCRWVIPEKALCINSFRVIEPQAAKESH